MRYYSDELHKFFDTEEDCVEAEEQAYIMKMEEEEKIRKKKEEKETRKAEVEDAYKQAIKASKHFGELKEAFIRDYGGICLKYSSLEDDDK